MCPSDTYGAQVEGITVRIISCGESWASRCTQARPGPAHKAVNNEAATAPPLVEVGEIAAGPGRSQHSAAPAAGSGVARPS